MISDRLHRGPDVLLTTNTNHTITNLTPRGLHNQIEKVLINQLQPGDIVTLHGYLFILSGDVVNIPCVKIYNGHPGLITMYSELKGKDPQQRAIDGCYPVVGCVLHEVVEEVDAGKVLMTSQMPMVKGLTTDELVASLRHLSVDMWTTFLKGVLPDAR
jgi:folate-dependent phosphoribosylglycinamide formyltransferase PurN